MNFISGRFFTILLIIVLLIEAIVAPPEKNKKEKKSSKSKTNNPAKKKTGGPFKVSNDGLDDHGANDPTLGDMTVDQAYDHYHFDPDEED
ncbi:hypothetical protein Ddc_20080 [Ditylenchus destructor]|nr:hypothetical protein Ddc_20080 [Ditylenchus destructor]